MRLDLGQAAAQVVGALFAGMGDRRRDFERGKHGAAS
jgi:hypothetical protein